jgi:hypothetical protein
MKTLISHTCRSISVMFIVLLSLLAAAAQTTDLKVAETENAAPGSENHARQTSYINNQTTLQTGANFNIAGLGTANIFNAARQYNVGGLHALSMPGTGNIFAGNGSGMSNTLGTLNTFIGDNAGVQNVSGDSNSFVGRAAGFFNTSGGNNSFIGRQAGFNNKTGSHNSFLGVQAGLVNTTGGYNTIIGAFANLGANNLSYATALGAGAIVSTNNTIVLGRSSGVDKVRIFGLGAGGSTQLCRNTNNEISTCSSSLRYKTNIAPFSSGLNLIRQLRPIRFEWKDGGMKDVGFGAEDIAAIEPLLVTYNANGEVEGVKYDRLTTVLVNAVKEQQTQIEAQQRQLKQQQAAIDGLKKLLCGQHPDAEVCRQ